MPKGKAFSRESNLENFARFGRFRENWFPQKLLANFQFMKFAKLNFHKNFKISNGRNQVSS